MRKLLVLSFLVSLPVFACPNLAGTYSECRSTTGQTSGSTNVLIEQKIVNKFQVYTMTATDENGETTVESWTADGKTKTVTETDPDTGMIMTTHMTAGCTGATLNLKAIVMVDEQEMANIGMKINKPESEMNQVVTGTVFGERITDTLICK